MWTCPKKQHIGCFQLICGMFHDFLQKRHEKAVTLPPWNCLAMYIYIYASSSFLCDFQVSSLPGVSKAQYEQVEDSNLCMFDSTVEPSSPQKVGGFMVTQRSSETQKAIHTISYNTSNTFKYLSDAWSKLLFLLNCPKMDLKLLWDLASWFQVMKRC